MDTRISRYMDAKHNMSVCESKIPSISFCGHMHVHMFCRAILRYALLYWPDSVAHGGGAHIAGAYTGSRMRELLV